MPILGITGGIASGKSTFTRLLTEKLEAEVFDSDRQVHRLLQDSPEVIAEIAAHFGADVLDGNGQVSRSRLGAIVFSDDAKRKCLERILHPRVRSAWTALTADRQFRDRWLLIDIPLLFETNADREISSVALVACSRATQLDRMTRLRGIGLEQAQKMIAAQMDMSLKTARATQVVWNDGALAALEAQVTLCARALSSS